MEPPEVAEAKPEIERNETSEISPEASSVKDLESEITENQDSEPTEFEEHKDPEALKENQQPWHRKLLGFLVSYFGLFLIFALYTAGGALYFHQREGKFEDENYQEMMTEHDNLKESNEYLSEYLSDILYEGKEYNNCTDLIGDPCYQPNIQDYRKACRPTCENSDFCTCVKIFMRNFEMDAKASIEKFVEQTVRVASTYDYSLNENGSVIWYPVWTYPNSLLFCMTTLTLIGK